MNENQSPSSGETMRRRFSQEPDKVNSTYLWKIDHIDGRILTGYSKWMGCKEQPDKNELIRANLTMFWKQDYIPTKAKKIDYFLKPTQRADDLVLLLTVSPRSFSLENEALRTHPKWSWLRDFLDQLYFTPKQPINVADFLTGEEPEKPFINVTSVLHDKTIRAKGSVGALLTLDDLLDVNKVVKANWTTHNINSYVNQIRREHGELITDAHIQHFKYRAYEKLGWKRM